MTQPQRADDRCFESKTKHIAAAVPDGWPAVDLAPRHVHSDPPRRFDFFDGQTISVERVTAGSQLAANLVLDRLRLPNLPPAQVVAGRHIGGERLPDHRGCTVKPRRRRNSCVEWNEFDLPSFGVPSNGGPRKFLCSGALNTVQLVLIEGLSAPPNEKSCRNIAIPPQQELRMRSWAPQGLAARILEGSGALENRIMNG
jgi:hypothetical protein